MRSLRALKIIRVSFLIALVPTFAALGVHAAVGRDASREMLLSVVSGTLFAATCGVDSRIRRRPMVFDGETFVFFAWPVAVPYYLIWTRGWWGVFAIALLTAILFGTAMVAGIATAIALGRV